MELREEIANCISVNICAKCGKVGKYCDECSLSFEYEVADQILSIPLLKALLEKAEQTRDSKGEYQLDRLVVLDDEQELPSLAGKILEEPFEILRRKNREPFAAGCHAYKEAMLNEGWRKVKEVL